MKEQILKLEQVFAKAKGISIELQDLKTVKKLMQDMSRKASIVANIFDALDGEMLERRQLRERAEEQVQEVEDAKSNLKGSENELQLAKDRTAKAQDELNDDKSWLKEQQTDFKKLDDKAKSQEKLVKARQKQYISESKAVGKDVAKLKKAYADLQKAGKALGIAKIPVEMYNEYLADGEEWGTGKLPSGFTD
jgi:DNA repair ATPase RecN